MHESTIFPQSIFDVVEGVVSGGRMGVVSDEGQDPRLGVFPVQQTTLNWVCPLSLARPLSLSQVYRERSIS